MNQTERVRGHEGAVRPTPTPTHQSRIRPTTGGRGRNGQRRPTAALRSDGLLRTEHRAAGLGASLWIVSDPRLLRQVVATCDQVVECHVSSACRCRRGEGQHPNVRGNNERLNWGRRPSPRHRGRRLPLFHRGRCLSPCVTEAGVCQQMLKRHASVTKAKCRASIGKPPWLASRHWHADARGEHNT